MFFTCRRRAAVVMATGGGGRGGGGNALGGGRERTEREKGQSQRGREEGESMVLASLLGQDAAVRNRSGH